MQRYRLVTEVERLLRAQRAIAHAFENARIPDRVLAAAYEACRKAGVYS